MQERTRKNMKEQILKHGAYRFSDQAVKTLIQWRLESNI